MAIYDGENLDGGRTTRPDRVRIGGDEGADGAGDWSVDEEDAARGKGRDGAAGGGLALREDQGADTAAGEKHGFKRSIETVQGLADLDNTKVFSFLSSTLKGPMYGGVKGLLTASIRTKTARQEDKEDGTDVC